MSSAVRRRSECYRHATEESGSCGQTRCFNRSRVPDSPIGGRAQSSAGGGEEQLTSVDRPARTARRADDLPSLLEGQVVQTKAGWPQPHVECRPAPPVGRRRRRVLLSGVAPRTASPGTARPIGVVRGLDVLPESGAAVERQRRRRQATGPCVNGFGATTTKTVPYPGRGRNELYEESGPARASRCARVCRFTHSPRSSASKILISCAIVVTSLIEVANWTSVGRRPRRSAQLAAAASERDDSAPTTMAATALMTIAETRSEGSTLTSRITSEFMYLRVDHVDRQQFLEALPLTRLQAPRAGRHE